MKRLLMVGVLFGVGCNGGQVSEPTGSADATPEPESSLDGPPVSKPWRVATWNLTEFPRSPAHLNAVVSAIKYQGFDLVALQEVTPAVEIATLLSDFDFHPSGAGGNGSVVLGWSTRLFEAVEGSRAFPAGPYLRPPVAIRLRVRGTDVKLLVVSVHLKAGLDDGDIEQRAREVEALAAATVSMRSADEELLLLGDFNVAPRDPSTVRILKPLVDAGWIQLTAALRGPEDASFLPAKILLDHVFVSQGLVAAVVGSGPAPFLKGVTDVDFLMTYGDHRPVVTDFNFHSPCDDANSCLLGSCWNGRCVADLTEPEGAPCGADQHCRSGLCTEQSVCTGIR